MGFTRVASLQFNAITGAESKMILSAVFIFFQIYIEKILNYNSLLN